MANQKLFIEANVCNGKVGNSMSTTYTYDGNTLTLFRKGRKVIEKTGVKVGDAFIVKCNGSEPTICKLRVPHRNDDLLMWLLSFDKENRAYSADEYQQLLKQQRERHDQSKCHECSIEGKGYAFTLCSYPDCNGTHRIAAYVHGANKAMVKEIFQKCGRGLHWPQDFIDGLSKKRFNFSNAELKKLHAPREYNLPLAE